MTTGAAGTIGFDDGRCSGALPVLDHQIELLLAAEFIDRELVDQTMFDRLIEQRVLVEPYPLDYGATRGWHELELQVMLANDTLGYDMEEAVEERRIKARAPGPGIAQAPGGGQGEITRRQLTVGMEGL